MVNRKTKGWVIIQEYKYNGIRNNPLGYIYSDGSYSGYVYIYPSKKCAEISLLKAQKNFKNLKIKKIECKIITE